uniref:MULE transposase domain-containing protein n=1 Tax=Lactuca sativa TaxID=4236 RepID=A0A9R1UUZ6_LACSA|nr:hypothetical protein LSAT_V11C800405860 [Lactuca sativa]
MDILGCVEEGKLLCYHFKRPLSDLDTGLFALACDSDINHLRTYVGKHKLIEVYTEHGLRKLLNPPACSKRLFLEWKTSTTGDCSGSTIPEVDQCGKPPNEPQFQTQGFDHDFDHCENPLNDFDQDLTSFVQDFDQDFTAFVQDEVNQSEDMGVHGDDLTDSEDSDFLLDEDNMIEEPDIDMKEFFSNIDQNAEWMGDNGGSSMNVEDAIREAEENSEAHVTDPFYLYQSFGSSEELKNKIKQHVVETRREIVIIKNDKNRVRAVCKGSIQDLIEVGVGGHVEERKCPWVLYASKWSNDADWEVRTYEKKHVCLQTRIGKACTYKFLSKQIVQQVESNPTIPTRALQEQLQRQYQCDISKMKVFRAKTEENIHVRGDYAGQYSILRDYVLELQTRNPNTTVKIEVETEPNPHCESRIFKRIYICLGSLKKGFAAGKRDYIGLDGSFMKGPYPGIVLTAVGLDGNNCTYPLAYAVVEAENINSWTWFLNCLGDDLELHSNSNFTFISDRQKGLLHAVGTLFPCAEHRFCLRHIHENMKKQWRGRIFQETLWNCATVTTVQEFHHAMEEFKKLNNDCYEWLVKYASLNFNCNAGRAHCDGLLNNLCESLNSQLQKEREQPIITCLEFIREYLMVRIVTVQKVIDKASGPLTPTATTVLEK